MDGDIIASELALQALPNGHLSASAQVPLLFHENDSLEAFLDRTLLSLYDQPSRRQEITVGRHDCYESTGLRCISAWNGHEDELSSLISLPFAGRTLPPRRTSPVRTFWRLISFHPNLLL
jgi:hypothetical protein